jgi:predicted dehydrogenase
LAEELVQTPLFAENEADFAVLVVPPEHREELVDLALAHGCDILSEKPIADSMEASIRIHRRVRESGRKMAVTMSHRFDQDKQTLERLVSSGDYGAPSYVVGRLTYNARAGYPWLSKRLQDVADSLIFDMAVHHFDVIRALGGANARMVYARAWVPPWSRWAGGGTALTLIELENGVPAFYEISMSNASTLIPWDAEYWRVECELATLELDRRELRLLRNDEPDAIPKSPCRSARHAAGVGELVARRDVRRLDRRRARGADEPRRQHLLRRADVRRDRKRKERPGHRRAELPRTPARGSGRPCLTGRASLSCSTRAQTPGGVTVRATRPRGGLRLRSARAA